MTKTAIIYTRVSTDEQARVGYSLRQQTESLREWCASEGFEVLAEVEDAGCSGAFLERPGLDQVRDLVEAGGVSVVVAQDRDRLSREPAYLYLLRQEFERHGTTLRALNDRDDGSPEGALTDGILDQLGKFERAKIAERTRRGLDRKVREGRVIRGNQAPYGFRYGEDGEALMVYEPEMAVVRRIFRMVGAEGASLGEVQRTLKGEGVPSAMGGWPRSTVRYLILNELYRPLTTEEVAACGLVPRGVASALPSAGPFGLWTWNKMRVRRSVVRAKDGTYRNRVKNEARPREQWSAVPVDISEAGLFRELVDAARERLAQNERRPASTRARRFWLLSGGMARCARCGNAYSPHTVHDRGKIRPYYRCYTRFNHGLDACTNGRSTQAAPLEHAVWEAVRSLCSDPDRVLSQYDAHVERLHRQMRGDPDAEVRALLERLRKLNRRRSAFHDLAADGDMSREELRAKLAEVDEQREEVRKVLREARYRQEMVHNLERDRKLLRDRFANMQIVDLYTLAPEGRRRVMQALRLRVDVDEQSNVRISGAFDADISEILPSMNGIPFAERDTRHFHAMSPPPLKGVVTVDSAPRIPGARAGVPRGRMSPPPRP